MMERAADYIIRQQLKQNNIQDDEVSIYRYGYIVMLEIMINIIIAAIIGICTGEMLNVIFFLALFIPLRSFSGGYHASKAWSCTMISCVILTVVVLVEKYNLLTLDIISIIIIELICCTVIMLLSPLESPGKPLNTSEKKVYKKRTFLVLTLELLAEILLVLNNMESLAYIIVMVHVTMALAQIVGIILYKYSKEVLD